MNNYWFTNYRASQSGPHAFEYVIRAVPKDLPNHEALRFGWEQRHPLRAKVVHVEGGGGLPAEGSFAEVRPRNVVLTALKKTRIGDGYLVRCLEQDGEASETAVQFPLLGLTDVWRMDLVEQKVDGAQTERSGEAVLFEQGPSSWATVGVGF
jgi:alpha-mannosidase